MDNIEPRLVNMTGLMDLATEVREIILLDVILDTMEQQPAQPSDTSNGYRCIVTHINAPGLFLHGECKSLKRDAMPLLHINQMIRKEVFTLLSLRKLKQRVDDAKLDILFDQYWWYYVPAIKASATWLSAPFPAYHLNTLHMQIRYFQDVDEFRTGPQWRPFHGTEDCHIWADSLIADMLLRFLAEVLRTKAGSASIHERQRTTTISGTLPSHRTIQKLVLEIPVDPDVPDLRPLRCLMCQERPHFPPLKETRCMVPSGKRAALMLAINLYRRLLALFFYVAESPGDNTVPRIVFERVGIIDINVQGRLFRRINLGQILAMIPEREVWSWAKLRRTEFFGWKRAAENKRKAAGFELFNPSVQEHHLAGYAGLICSILAARDDSLFGAKLSDSDTELSDSNAEVSDNDDEFSGGDAQPVGQAARGEQVAFTGKAVVVQDDGSNLLGDATFYCSSSINWGNRHRNPGRYDFPPLADEQLGERPREGEHVLFEGEAIIFTGDLSQSIVSGDAIFYGTEETRMVKRPSRALKRSLKKTEKKTNSKAGVGTRQKGGIKWPGSAMGCAPQ